MVSNPLRRKHGPKPKDSPGASKGKVQRNFVDPDLRMTKNSDKRFVQAHNAQATQDSESQIMVAVDFTN